MGLPWFKIEKLIQELAWRDYWQQVYIAKGNAIFSDLKHPQLPINNHQIPTSVIQGKTGIQAIDQAISLLNEKGYMHNHMRMYVASICCNIAQSHWSQPAKWMYSELLDGDLASNTLSWQWVAGSFSNKKYYANQKNINKYFKSVQRNTFLDVEYHEFEQLLIPNELKATIDFSIEYELPKTKLPNLASNRSILIYNYYNLDPYWYNGADVERILLLEPSFFERYPVSQKCIDFTLKLSENIPGMQVFVSEFQELLNIAGNNKLIYKEHPTNLHYKGIQVERDWISSVKGYFPSFFKFWKQCIKELKL